MAYRGMNANVLKKSIKCTVMIILKLCNIKTLWQEFLISIMNIYLFRKLSKKSFC